MTKYFQKIQIKSLNTAEMCLLTDEDIHTCDNDSHRNAGQQDVILLRKKNFKTNLNTERSDVVLHEG